MVKSKQRAGNGVHSVYELKAMKKGWSIALSILLIGVIGAYVWFSRLKNRAEREGEAFNDTLKPRLEMSFSADDEARPNPGIAAQDAV